MFGGMDPAKLAQAKLIGKHVTAELHIDEKAGTFTLKLIPSDEAGKEAIGPIAKQLGMGLATQLKMFFGVTGKIT
jgi:hypothetical protein